MELTINIYSSFCQILPKLPYELAIRIDDKLAFGIEGARYTQQFISKKWDGRKHLFSLAKQSFPTGYLKEVVDLLEEQGFFPVINDRRGLPDSMIGTPLPLAFKPWDHQIDIIKACAAESRGLIQASTGSGKSYAMAAVYALYNVPGVIITYRKELMYQLRDSIQEALGIKVGIFGDGVWEKGKLTVCMAQSLLKVGRVRYTKILKDYEDSDKKSDKLIAEKKLELFNELILGSQLVVVDEVHHSASAGTYAVLQAMTNAYWRYGFSATAYGFREDKKDFLIKASFGDVISEVTTSDLVDAGILVPTDIIPIGFSHAGKRYPKDTYAEYYDKAVVENDARNKLVIQVAYHLAKNKKPVLIAVQRVDHGKNLEKALQYLVGKDSAKFVYGDDKSDYRDNTLITFKEGKLPILISTLISEGVDIPMLECVIGVRGEESRIATIQLLGRAMRTYPGKKKAVYIDIMDQKTYWLGKHSRTRAKVFASERVFNVLPVTEKGLQDFLKTYEL